MKLKFVKQLNVKDICDLIIYKISIRTSPESYQTHYMSFQNVIQL